MRDRDSVHLRVLPLLLAEAGAVRVGARVGHDAIVEREAQRVGHRSEVGLGEVRARASVGARARATVRDRVRDRVRVRDKVRVRVRV